MDLPSGRAVVGGTLVLATAAGFVLESAWLFLAAMILFFAWCGYVLLSPDES